ncbi:hypothetical protein OVY01_20915 [Robbsia sp. Bb-Pol-6]|uniref:Antitoxin VbhA domain-containing protein n=1 Tax=Robbsia betulipollinis TaxID=2981849 RepID=A0ABT3ZTP9_9BURK|nr:hypothetical protein [Robbsia betulipollinis]MCY0389612.1 hypothetical protein [Robbsia betulipollinis]
MSARCAPPALRDLPAALSPAEEWCAASLARQGVPDRVLPRMVERSYGASVNHEAIISEVKRRRKA